MFLLRKGDTIPLTVQMAEVACSGQAIVKRTVFVSICWGRHLYLDHESNPVLVLVENSSYCAAVFVGAFIHSLD